MSKSREQLNEFLRSINIENKLVLDVGAGPETKHAKHFTFGEPAVYHTIDIDPTFVPTYSLDVNEDLCYAQDWKATPKLDYYDIIFAFETFEHLWHPVQALRNVFSWLKPGGYFYFSAPFINPIHDVHDYLRLTYEWWAEAGVRIGFESIDVLPRYATEGSDLLTNFFKAEGLRMSKIRLPHDADKLTHIGYMGHMKKSES